VKYLSSVCLLLALILAGCSGTSEASLIGKWKGAPKMPEAKKDDPMAKFGEAMMSMFSFDLELKEKNEFTMMVAIIPISGTWSVSGNTVTLTPKTVMGLTPEEFQKENQKNNPTAKSSGDPTKPIRLEVLPDGKSMKALDDMGGGGGPDSGELIFTKQS